MAPTNKNAPCRPVIPAFKRLRDRNYEFMTSLAYMLRLYLKKRKKNVSKLVHTFVRNAPELSRDSNRKLCRKEGTK
jgi:hypothetical protein